jgi:hypothetical protein
MWARNSSASPLNLSATHFIMASSAFMVFLG